mgnify:CR=1 FL=1
MHGFGPREGADRLGHRRRDDVGRGPPLLADVGEIEFSLLVVLDLERVEAQARRFEEAVDRRLGGIDAGTLALLDDIGVSTLIGETRLDESRGHQGAEILGRLLLHAGGDFLGEKFEQEFGHCHCSGRPGD